MEPELIEPSGWPKPGAQWTEPELTESEPINTEYLPL